MTLGYLGTEKVILTRFDTIQTSVQLATKNAAGDYDYLFGKPIFTEGDYVMRISAHEDYYYNANKSLGTHEQVNLHGGNVRVYNGMHSESEVITGTLDENGEMQTVLRADYPTHTRLGDDATRSIQVSVEYQGEYIQSDPLDVYVFADRTDNAAPSAKLTRALRSTTFCATHREQTVSPHLPKARPTQSRTTTHLRCKPA